MYLVTGGCGFIGSHLVDLLVEKGEKVRVLDDLSNSTRAYLNPEAEFLLGSIADEKIWEAALENVKGVFHLAAMISVTDSINYWHKGHLINCGGTVNLLARAKKIPIIFASSAAVYGDTVALPHREENPLKPLSPYAVDKLSSEMQAQLAWQLHQTPSVAFRFFNVYGPRQNPNSPYAGVISKFIHQISHQKPVTIYGDGSQQRDFIYVQDVVQMLWKTMKTPFVGSHVYNLCTGKTCTINALADLIGEITGRPVLKEYAPLRPGEILISQGDPSKIFKEKQLHPKISLEEGLKFTIVRS